METNEKNPAGHSKPFLDCAEEVSAKCEANYRFLFQESPAINMIIDTDGIIKDLNKSALRSLGHGKDEIVGKPALELVVPEQRERVAGHLQRILKKEDTPEIEIDVLTKNGSIHTLLFSPGPLLFGQDDESASILITGLDITERRRIEEEVRKMADTAIEFVDFPPERDIYDFLGEKVEEFVGEAVIAVNSIDEEKNTLRVRRMLGIEPQKVKMVSQLLGTKAVGMSLKEIGEEAKLKLTGGKLEKVEGGLCELLFHNVPKAICREIEKLLGIEEIYSIGLRRKGRLFGSVTIITLKKTRLNKDIVETLAGQASIALERRRAEDALRESEERYRNLFENSPIGIYRTTPDGRILMANPVLIRMLGYSSFEELASRNLEKEGFEPSYPRSQFKELVERDGEVEGLEAAWIRGDESVIFVREKAKAIRGKDGTILYYEGTVENVTGRKKVEKALRESEELYRTFIDSTSDIAFVKDEGFRYLIANKACIEYFGKKQEGEIIGKSDFELMPREPAEGCRHSDIKALKSEDIVVTEELAGDRTLETRKFPVRLSENRLGIGGYVRDITERKQAEEALRVSEQRYRLLFERNLAAVYRTTLEGTVVECNESFVRLLGYDSREEVLSRPASEFYFHAADREGFIQSLREQGTLTNFEFRMRRKDGSPVWILENVSLIEDDEGTQILQGTSIDITERKRAEEALRDSEERYRILFESAPEAIIIIDLDGTILDCNDKAGAVSRLSRQELVGKYFTEMGMFEDEDKPRSRQLFSWLMCGEGLGSFEIQVAGANNEIRWVEAFPALLKKNNQPYAIQIISRDVTERKQAEEALRESERKYRSLVEQSMQGITVVQDFHIVFANNAFAKISGYTVEELLSLPPEKVKGIIHPEDQALVWGRFKERSTGKPVPPQYEYRGIRKDGSVCWVEMSASRVDYGGKPAIQGTFVDITERKQAEEALLNSEERFRTIVETAPSLLVISDADGNNTYLSPNCEETTGYTQGELEGRMIWWVHEDDSARAKEVYGCALREGVGGRNFEYKAVKKNGELWYASSSWEPLRDKEGKFQGVVMQTIDISERKLAERAVRESEERYRSLFEDSPISLWEEDFSQVKKSIDGLRNAGVTDLKKYLREHPDVVADYASMVRVVDVNRASLELFQADTKVELQRDIRDTFTEDSYDAFLEELVSLGEGKTEFVTEAVSKTLKGEKKHVVVRWSVAPGHEKTLSKVLVSISDVTERKRAEEALRDSRRMLQTVLDSIPSTVFWKDRDSIYLGANRALLETAGLESSEEIVGKSDYHLTWGKKQADSFREDDRRVMESGIHQYGIIEQYLRADGTRAWAMTNKVPLRDTDGNVVGVLGTSEDITERKRAEDLLLTSEAQLSNAMKIAQLGYWEYDVAEDLFTFNDHFYAIFRTSAEKVGGYSMSSARYAQLFVHPDDRSVVGIEIQKALEATDPHFSRQLEHRIIYADGETGYISVRFFIVKDNQGRTVKTYGANQDITERKRAEEQIEYQAQLLAMVNDAVVASDAQYRLTTWNAAAESMYGWKAEEVLGRFGLDVTSTEFPGVDKAEMLRAIAERGTWRGDATQVRKDGTRFPVEVSSVVLRDAAGKVTGFVSVNRDITERKRAEEALRESEERFRIASQIASDVVYERDAQTGVATFYGDIDSHLGYEPGGYPRTMEGWRKHVHPEDLAWINNKSIDQLEPGVPHTIEYRMRKKDGTYMTWLDRIMTIPDKKTGKPLRFIGAATDITERKRAEEELQRTHFAIDSAPEGIAWLDKDFHYIYVNEGMCRMLGYTRDELLFLKPSELDLMFPQVSPAELWAEMRGIKSKVREGLFRRKDRTTFPVELTLDHVVFKDEEYIFSIMRDITERKRAEVEIRKLSQYLETIIDNANIWVDVLDEKANVTIWNKAAEQISGFSRVEVIGHGKIWEWLYPDEKYRNEITTKAAAIIEEGEVVEDFETIIRCKNDETKTISWNSRNLLDADGKPIGSIALGRDVTENKRMQSQLIQAEKLTAVGTLAYGIAHEFNNILAGILGNAEFGMGSDDPQEVKESFHIIIEGCDRAKGITASLLAFSRQRQEKKEMADVTDAVDTVLGLTERELEKQNVNVVRNFKPIPEIACDLGELSGVVLNMITNARDAMRPGGGTLAIEVSEKRDCIEMIFSDTGCGIPDSIKSRIFEPFVTTKGALGQSEIPGTGLGLFLSYGIINRYAGSVEVKSKVGKGSKFTIRIPISRNQVLSPPVESNREKTGSVPQHLTILLVDDEPTICAAIKKFLEAQGHSVTTALSGRKALENFKKGGYQVVLADITMPDMDGVRLISELKKIDQQVKCIVLTGHMTEEKLESAKKAGADAMLIKPFKNEELYQVMARVLLT